MDNSKDRAKQAQQWRNHSDICEVDHPIIQIRCDSRSLRLGDFTGLLQIRLRILGHEIEHFLHDPRDRFPMPIRNGEQPQIIALTQKRVRSCHITGRNHGATPDCHQVDYDQHDKKDRQQKQWNHYGAGFNQRLQDGCCVRSGTRGGVAEAS